MCLGSSLSHSNRLLKEDAISWNWWVCASSEARFVVVLVKSTSKELVTGFLMRNQSKDCSFLMCRIGNCRSSVCHES